MVKHSVLNDAVATGFEAVREAIQAIAKAEDQLEAQLAIYHRGTLVVDLWTGPAITADTLLGVYSVSRGRRTSSSPCWCRTGC